MRLEESWLKYLLEWADHIQFSKAPMIRPAFPEYVLMLRSGRQGEQFSQIYIKKIIRASYRFFVWLSSHHRGFGEINQIFLDTLKPPRMTVEPKEHEAVTFEEIRAIAQAPVYSIRDRRIRAAAVFWFLSGIRLGAFVSLPVSAVDLENLTIRQWPKLGVRTKFKKHATTYLLDIPELMSVVKDWDKEVRAASNNLGIWFAPISPETGKIEPAIREIGEHRNTRARKDLKDWLERVGLPYHSPHKFRHGHAVFALMRAKDVPALKAVSQNLMHSNLSITDGVYGVLSGADVKGEILALSKKIIEGEANDITEVSILLKKILEKLDKS
jgi:integrase